MKDFYELFINDLKTMYHTEKEIVKSLPDMIKAASDPKLKEALQHHLKETREQVKRLEQISKELKQPLTGSKSKIIESLIKEVDNVIAAKYDKLAKDAALIACGQLIEHFEIASYGTLRAYAKHFKLQRVEMLLEESAKEEGHANKKLTEIAEGTIFTSGINTEACRKCA